MFGHFRGPYCVAWAPAVTKAIKQALESSDGDHTQPKTSQECCQVLEKRFGFILFSYNNNVLLIYIFHSIA